MSVAIDPGANGGIAIKNKAVTAQNLPKSDRELCHLLRDHQGERTAYLEDLVRYTGRNMPSSSMSVYASSHGKIHGMLIALEYKIVLVKPQAWQKACGLGTSTGMGRTEWKRKLAQEAERLYPKCKVTLATADALLILRAAELGRLG